MNLPLLNHFLSAGSAWVWRTSLEATVLIALVLAAQIFFKRLLTPRWRYALGLLVLLRLAMPALPASSLSIFNLKTLFTAKRVTAITIGAPIPADSSQTFSQPFVTAPIVANIQPHRRIDVYLIARFVWLFTAVAILTRVAWLHRMLSLQIRRRQPIADAPILDIFSQCKKILGLKRNIRLISSSTLSTPALFGFARPCVIIPEGMHQRLDERELRLIFFHELIHLRRGDVLINWAIILVRAVHWFNPAVWLFLRCLRIDQELACDAAVLSRLVAEDRRLYGNTLIKLAENSSIARLCPSLVPLTTKKHNIQRRITMISTYRRAGRFSLISSLALIIAVATFTFTSASSRPLGDDPSETRLRAGHPAMLDTEQTHLDGAAAKSASHSMNQSRQTLRSLEAFQHKLQLQDHAIVDLEAAADKLRADLHISDEVASGNAASSADIAHYHSVRIDAETQLVHEEKMLDEYKKLDRSQLIQVLSSTSSDPILTTLIQQQLATGSKLIGLRSNQGENHPDVLQTDAILKDLNEKIQARTEGLLAAMQMRISSWKAVAEDAMKRAADAEERDRHLSEKARPYFLMKADLERARKFRDLLAVRMAQEQMDLALPKKSTGF